MLNFIKRLLSAFNTRIGLVWYLAIFLWIKTLIAYISVFNLRGVGVVDNLMIFINPFSFTIAAFSLTLFIKRTPIFYTAIGCLSALATLILFGNINYYREFTDFLTIDTIISGSRMFGTGALGVNSIPTNMWDFIYWIDFIIIIVLFIVKRIKIDTRPIETKRAFTWFSFALMLFGLNFWAADVIKPQLIMARAQSDKTYVVRYLGLGPWMLTDSYYTHLANSQRANAKLSTFQNIQKYIKDNRYLAPNITFEQSQGVQKKNVILIHLESFQQFLIDLSITGTDNQQHVVTPFLNSIYHSTETYSFNNFYSQIGQGKTSDAETLLETSTFGLPAGSFLSKDGSTQTFQAMPAILSQTQGYSTAVFHGNAGSFYNRINSYKSMGYQNFFDQSYFDANNATLTSYGIKDKLLFHDSVPYLEQLQQPFYVKYLTVSNHLNYDISQDDWDPNFKTTDSGNKLIDKYFVTAHYLDQAIKEFYDYLKVTGLYDKSMIVLYGDHFGIPDSNSADLSTILKTATDAPHFNQTDYNDFDWTQLQKTPFMINIPGNTSGHIINTYVGELDVMPTIEHLLGVDTSKYVQFGQDMFASGRADYVALRNGGFVTPTITLPSVSSKVFYDTQTGLPITAPTPDQVKYVADTKMKVAQLLQMSDNLNNQNLLRFYTPDDFKPVNTTNYDYSFKTTLKRLANQQKSLGAGSTSLWSQNGNKTSWNNFITNAPELINGTDKPKYKPSK